MPVLFFLFSDPKRAVELYNAISGENLPPDTELTYTTLENSIEIVVNLVNLNYNVDTEILKRSPTLLGYSKLLCYIREELASNGGGQEVACFLENRGSGVRKQDVLDLRKKE